MGSSLMLYAFIRLILHMLSFVYLALCMRP